MRARKPATKAELLSSGASEAAVRKLKDKTELDHFDRFTSTRSRPERMVASKQSCQQPRYHRRRRAVLAGGDKEVEIFWARRSEWDHDSIFPNARIYQTVAGKESSRRIGSEECRAKFGKVSLT